MPQGKISNNLDSRSNIAGRKLVILMPMVTVAEVQLWAKFQQKSNSACGVKSTADLVQV